MSSMTHAKGTYSLLFLYLGEKGIPKYFKNYWTESKLSFMSVDKKYYYGSILYECISGINNNSSWLAYCGILGFMNIHGGHCPDTEFIVGIATCVRIYKTHIKFVYSRVKNHYSEQSLVSVSKIAPPSTLPKALNQKPYHIMGKTAKITDIFKDLRIQSRGPYHNSI